MTRRLAILAAALLLCFQHSALAAKLMVVSDLHYLAEECYQGSEWFISALRRGDGKLTQYGETLMAALCDEVETQKPDALIVTGDLSFNGERASHEALADWFARIEAGGTPVWVIPGNHDINNRSARRYTESRSEPVEAVTADEFSAIYADYMLPAEGDANLSYCVEVGDELCVAMTDVAFYRENAYAFGVFTAGHGEWLERVLREHAGVECVTATHHSLIAHTEFSKDSYLMLGSESMAALLRRYGARLNLSGHLHCQNIQIQNALVDAALGAFCLWPHRWALVTLKDGRLEYEAKSLDDSLLPEGFMEMSRAWFEGIAKDKTLSALEAAGIEGEQAEIMADYAARFNLAYFSGTYRRGDASWTEDPAYALWRDNEGLMSWQYMEMVMNEATGENLYLQIGE